MPDDVIQDLKREKKMFSKRQVDHIKKDHGTRFTICTTGTDKLQPFL